MVVSVAAFSCYTRNLEGAHLSGRMVRSSTGVLVGETPISSLVVQTMLLWKKLIEPGLGVRILTGPHGEGQGGNALQTYCLFAMWPRRIFSEGQLQLPLPRKLLGF